MLSARSIRGRRHALPMYLARIVCSHGECTEEKELIVESLDELDEGACPCGYGFVVVSVSEVELV